MVSGTGGRDGGLNVDDDPETRVEVIREGGLQSDRMRAPPEL